MGWRNADGKEKEEMHREAEELVKEKEREKVGLWDGLGKSLRRGGRSNRRHGIVKKRKGRSDGKET